MQPDPIVIVGAGIAGLVAAIQCAARGERVTIVEKDDGPGGKMSARIVAGRAIDNGPTVLTMPDVFADLGVALPPLTRAGVLARHCWSDGRLDLHADAEESERAVAAFAGAADAAGYRRFSRAAATIHAALADSFMAADKPASPLSLLCRAARDRGWRGVADFTKLDPYRPLAAMLRDHFADPRLRQLFGRYTTYCGSSPYRAPATLALIAEVERQGVWLVEGGMRALAAALLDGAVAQGAEARFGVAVDEVLVERGRACGVRLVDGERLAASAVIVAADAAALADGHFGAAAARGRRRFTKRDRSFSAFTAAFVADAGDAPLVRHTIAFADDAAAEFAALAAGRIADDPTVYLCAQDRADDDAPTGRDETFLIVVNAPGDGDTHDYSAAEIDRCMSAITRRLERSGIPLAIDRSRCSISTPSDFARRFPATGGALYGRASHGWTASFRRPGARTRVRGLYCAGGSVHPGAGVPMAALSGKAAVRALLADRASTWRFPRAAMPGGTSMRSATADAVA